MKIDTESLEALLGLDGELWRDLGERLTCIEADVIRRFLREHGQREAAQALYENHCLSDDDGDEPQHVRKRNELNNAPPNVVA